jgi:hypothetical protein
MFKAVETRLRLSADEVTSFKMSELDWSCGQAEATAQGCKLAQAVYRME